jgi:dTDP-4-dehydrorhamnose 3,5-epimerase
MEKPKPTISSEIAGLVLYELDYFQDHRGKNFEIYNSEVSQHDIHFPFRLDSCSVSTKNVLRGFHGDSCNWKLVQCLFGKIQLYVIDMWKGSPTYGNVKEFILSAEKPQQVLISPQIVNAHLCLSDHCVFYYKWSDGYVPVSKQIHVKWNDPRFRDKIKWQTENPILSDRDK